MPHRRNALLAGFSVLVAAAEAAEGIPDSDRTLIALVTELRAAVDAFNADLYECEATSCRPGDLEALKGAAFDHIEGLILRMATLRSGGLAGIAAKVGWLCDRLAETTLVGPEADLVESLVEDLARLQPEAVATRARGSVTW